MFCSPFLFCNAASLADAAGFGSGTAIAAGAGDAGAASAASGSRASAATRRRTSSPVSAPNPGTPSGAVKSQAFSASPTKSRIAGSAIQARRSAARATAAGTPDARKGLRSVAPLIDSIGGSGISAAVTRTAGASGAVSPSVSCGGSRFAGCGAAAARFRRDQRARKSAAPLTVLSRSAVPAAPAPRGRRGRAGAW